MTTSPIHLPRATAEPTAWPGGSVHPIYTHPTDTHLGDPSNLLTINTATIERSAPYSDFSGYTRVHVPISGGALRLHFREPEETVELGRFQQHTFDGGRPLRAEPVGEAVTAFNLILRRELEAVVSAVQVDEEPLSLPALAGNQRALRLLYVIEGIVQIEGSEIIAGAGDAVVWPVAASTAVRVGAATDVAVVIFVRVELADR